MGLNWVPAYIALGSNLDDPQQQIREALKRLATLPDTRLVLHSRLYRAAPLGPQNQPEFINAAAGLLTRLSPRDLLFELKGIEASMGRASAGVRWGPRRIDLDLLVHGSAQLNEDGLTVPHPGVPSRNFVLYPLLDIAPELIVPGHGPVRLLARRVAATGIVAVS